MSSGEFFSDGDARWLDALLADGPTEGRTVDPEDLPENPAAEPVSRELLRFSQAIGNEGLVLLQGLPALSLDTRQRLSQSILALNEVSFEDQHSAEQLEIATVALEAWGGSFTPVRAPLVLGANALRSIYQLGEIRVEVLGAAVTRFCGLPMPEYPSPEYAAYFSESLDEIPAHVVRGFGSERKIRPIQHAMMSQCLRGEVSLPRWAEVPARGGATALEYMQEYERRFMMTRAIFEPFISLDEDLGAD